MLGRKCSLYVFPPSCASPCESTNAAMYCEPSPTIFESIAGVTPVAISGRASSIRCRACGCGGGDGHVPDFRAGRCFRAVMTATLRRKKADLPQRAIVAPHGTCTYSTLDRHRGEYDDRSERSSMSEMPRLNEPSFRSGSRRTRRQRLFCLCF
jgi:hypothetical protein